MREGEEFLTDVVNYLEDKKPNEYKKLQALAKKYGDGSFSAYNGDIIDINDFSEFPNEADVKFYTLTDKDTINEEPDFLYLGEAHIKLKFDNNWFRASEEERYENYAYETPITDVVFKNIKIYDEDKIVKQVK